MSLKIGVRGWIVIELLIAAGIVTIGVHRHGWLKEVSGTASTSIASSGPTSNAATVTQYATQPAHNIKSLLAIMDQSSGIRNIWVTHSTHVNSQWAAYLKQIKPDIFGDETVQNYLNSSAFQIATQRVGKYVLVHPIQQYSEPGFILFVDPATGNVIHEDWGFSIESVEYLMENGDTPPAGLPAVVRILRNTLRGSGCNALGAMYYAVDDHQIHLALTIPWTERNVGWKAFSSDAVEGSITDQLVCHGNTILLNTQGAIATGIDAPEQPHPVVNIPKAQFIWNPGSHQFIQTEGRSMSGKSLLLTDVYGDLAGAGDWYYSSTGNPKGGGPVSRPVNIESKPLNLKPLIACFQKSDGSLTDLDRSENTPGYEKAVDELKKVLLADQSHFHYTNQVDDFFSYSLPCLRAQRLGRYILIHPTQQYNQQGFLLFLDPKENKIVYQDWLEDDALHSIQDSKVLASNPASPVAVVRINRVTNTGTGVHSLSAHYYAVDDDGVHLALQIPWHEFFSCLGDTYRYEPILGQLTDKLSIAGNKILLTTTGTITLEAELNPDPDHPKKHKTVQIPAATFQWQPTEHRFIQTTGRVMNPNGFLMQDVYGDLAGAYAWFHRPGFVPGSVPNEPPAKATDMSKLLACFRQSDGTYADLSASSKNYKKALNLLAQRLIVASPLSIGHDRKLNDYEKALDSGMIHIRPVGRHLLISDNPEAESFHFVMFIDPATGQTPWEEWGYKLLKVDQFPQSTADSPVRVRLVLKASNVQHPYARYYILDSQGVRLEQETVWQENLPIDPLPLKP